MRYKPKILINRTGGDVEFFCGGQRHFLKKGHKDNFDGFVAHHALKVVNTGLEEFTLEVEEELKDVEEKGGMPEFRALSWADLVKRGARSGLYERGMNKKELIKALENKWMS